MENELIDNKICNGCGEEFPLTEEYYYKFKTNKDGFNNKCKNCYKEAHKYNSEKSADYYIRNKDMVLNRQTEFYKNNKEEYSKYYFDNKEEKLQYQKEYVETHYDTLKVCWERAQSKRQALLLEQGGSYNKKEWQECLDFFDNKCCYSGECSSKGNLSTDHIIPITKGGTSHIWNIACCDVRINTSKGNKDLEQWYRKQPFFSEERLNRIYEWIKLKQIT